MPSFDKMIEQAVFARLETIGRKPDDYGVLISVNGNTLRSDDDAAVAK